MILTALLLAACAPTKPPVDQLDAASRALGAARDAGAAELAPADYRAAGLHFDDAQAAEGRQDYAEAGQLAQQSLADSELAAAKARAAKARQAVDGLRRDNANLERNLAEPVATDDQP